MTFEIYMVECPAGRRYVGCTSKGAEHRWRTHYVATHRRAVDAPEDIAQAIAKYGREAFSLTILASALDAASARTIETAMIAQWGSLFPAGYNRDACSNIPLRPYSGPHWTATHKHLWRRSAVVAEKTVDAA
jgi:hypothetical protein